MAWRKRDGAVSVSVQLEDPGDVAVASHMSTAVISHADVSGSHATVGSRWTCMFAED